MFLRECTHFFNILNPHGISDFTTFLRGWDLRTASNVAPIVYYGGTAIAPAGRDLAMLNLLIFGQFENCSIWVRLNIFAYHKRLDSATIQLLSVVFH